ncbi:MAG: hypothetical protein L3J98_09060 [Gammaproteobacteria bacterium]|nr:hypothetical protein [Gammaproteobacteria bacterium]MCF6260290.1 hypothetical protein [Gammaproteobacteria bacterium]
MTVRFHYDSGDAIFNTILLESDDRVYLYADGVRYKLNEVESVPLFPYTTKRQYSYEGMFPPFPGGANLRIAAERQSQTDAPSTVIIVPPPPLIIQPLENMAISRTSDIHLAWVKGDAGDSTSISTRCDQDVSSTQPFYLMNLGYSDINPDTGEHLIPAGSLEERDDDCLLVMKMRRFRYGTIDGEFRDGVINITSRATHRFTITP